MASLLYRLGTTAYRRWPIFLTAWLVIMVGLGTVAATMSKPMSDSFSIPGIASEKAADLQAELFPTSVNAFNQAGATVVVAAPEGHSLAEPTYRAQVDALVADLADGPQMPTDPAALPANPVDVAAGMRAQIVGASVEAGMPKAQAEANAAALLPLSPDGRVGLVSWNFDVDSPVDVEATTQAAVADAMNQARQDGLQVEANGSGLQSQQAGGASELVGVAIALVVLVLTFGSLVAAGLPLLTAFVGVGIGMLSISAMTAFTDISSSTTGLATMIGLAVGIDYALFILARYRSELEVLGEERRAEAVGRAVGTAGSAVTFAGLTVIIALAALAVVRIPFMTAMGLGAAATVLVAVLVALTLLPALLGLFKSKAFAGRVRRYVPRRDDDGRILNNGVRWARLVGRAPVITLLVVVAALGALALPAKGLHLALPSDSTAASDTTARKAADLVAGSFGAGRQAPLLVVVDGRDVAAADRGAAYGQVTAWAGGLDDVANAQVVATNADGTGAQIMVTPKSAGDDAKTEHLLTTMRDGQSQIEADTGTTMGVTGLTAIASDVSSRLASALPTYLAVVIGLAFLLLMLVFRSILVPLTATFGFLLSVLATLGATVAVFQNGALGLMEGQPIVSFMPIFLIGVVFGLAMDYQVFLVTRIREAHVHGADFRESVVDGFRNSARVVSAAALIMISVFAAFMLSDEPILKSMGFALAAAVFFDAFIVRMTLIPALMYLMGEKAWWLPRWLDRILPNVDIEGESLPAALPARAVAQADQDATTGGHADDAELVGVGG